MIYYTFTRKNIYKILSKESGFTIDEIESMFDEQESERTKKKDGFTKDALLDSVNSVRVRIYLRLKEDNPEKANAFYESDAPLKLIQFAADVYEAPYTMYTDVMSNLKILKNRGISMYVVTKGSFYGQSRKAAMLGEMFDGLFVLPHKDVATWNGVIESMQLDRTTTVVVGDSIKDDINPAILNKMRAIRIDRHSTTWVGDPLTESLEEVTVIETLDELVAMLTVD
jgi:FMN phosphatase YigB (HAD superfamily)